MYFNERDQLSRLDGPAFIKYYDNGKIAHKEYWVNGNRSHKDKPSIIEYDKNNNVSSEFFYYNNLLHRDHYPAVLHYYKDSTIKTEVYMRSGVPDYRNTSSFYISYAPGMKKKSMFSNFVNNILFLVRLMSHLLNIQHHDI